MHERRLRVMTEPEGASFVSCPEPGRKHEDIFLCGRCGVILARNIPAHWPAHSILKCYNCGARNES